MRKSNLRLNVTGLVPNESVYQKQNYQRPSNRKLGFQSQCMKTCEKIFVGLFCPSTHLLDSVNAQHSVQGSTVLCLNGCESLAELFQQLQAAFFLQTSHCRQHLRYYSRKCVKIGPVVLFLEKGKLVEIREKRCLDSFSCLLPTSIDLLIVIFNQWSLLVNASGFRRHASVEAHLSLQADT